MHHIVQGLDRDQLGVDGEHVVIGEGAESIVAGMQTVGDLQARLPRRRAKCRWPHNDVRQSVAFDIAC